MLKNGTIALGDEGNIGAGRVAGTARRERVLGDQVRLLYDQADIGVAANLASSAVVAWIFWDTLSSAALALWLVLVWAVTGLRVASIVSYRRSDHQDECAEQWQRTFSIGAVASGLAWGCGQWLFGSAIPAEYTLLYTFLLAGMAAGAIALMAHMYSVYVRYYLAMALPASLWFWHQGTQQGFALGVLSLVYAAALLTLARHHNRVSRANLSLASRNRYLEQAAWAREDAYSAQQRLQVEAQERRQVAEALRVSEARFRDFAEVGADLFWEMDESLRYRFVSDGFQRVMGIPAERVLGRVRREVLQEFILDAGDRLRHLEALEARAAFSDLRFAWKRPDGKTVVLLGSGKPVLDENGEFRGYRGATRDITESFTLSRKLAYQATHDALTGLVNRVEFERRMRNALESAREKGSTHALAYLDLDQFKVVNDTCGHEAGDELLRQLAELLKLQIEPGDTLARLGGDEFGLLQEHTDNERAKQTAERIRKTVEEFRFVWNDTVFTLGVSVGLSQITAACENIAQVQSVVDSACYTAKEQGRNRVHFCRPGDVRFAQRQGEMQWAPRITRALEEDRFLLALQPIEPIQDRSPGLGLHFEVLLRMRGERGEMIPPGVFLPSAERYGLAPKLDRWVVDKVFAWLSEDPDRLASVALCAINLSGTTLGDSGFADFVMRHLRGGTVPASKICFEVTETAAIANLGAAAKFMQDVKALGCRFSLDDFGSGVSSFGYLKTLPVDYLKIDGLFVKDIVDDPIDLAMVKSINEIGQVMGKRTIAEFVENREILFRLKELGVDYAQGYAVGRAIPIDEYSSARARPARVA